MYPEQGEHLPKTGGLYETESQRLQKEADDFTKMLEHERKSYLLLEDQYKQSLTQLQEIKSRISVKIPSEAKEHESKVKRDGFIHALANEKVRYNDTIGMNNKLTTEIDIMRKEITFAQASILKMKDGIGNLKEDTSKHHRSYYGQQKRADTINNEILALKATHESGKDVFEIEVKKLQETLLKRDDPIEFDDNRFNQTVMETKGPGGKKQEFANPIEILKIRLKTITNKNKEKKKLLDQYIRNARIIEEAFEQIKEATGISNIDEIVTTFIKAEEQNYSLYNYVNVLNQETDQLEETSKYLDSEINRYEQLSMLDKEELEDENNLMEEKAEALRDEIMKSTEECNEVQKDFTIIQNEAKVMVNGFQEAKFELNVANPMKYDEMTQFNENNITNYLAELEEHISNLITYRAFQREDVNAPISSVPFEYLNQKEFNKEKMHIDPPITTERQTDEGDDELLTANALYKRFVDEVSQLKYTKQSQVKREGGAPAMANQKQNEMLE